MTGDHLVTRNLCAQLADFFHSPACQSLHRRAVGGMSPPAVCKNDQAAEQCRESLAEKDDIWMMPAAAPVLQISPLNAQDVM